MLRLCSQVLVKGGMVRSWNLVKPVSAALVVSRTVTQQTGLPSLPVPALQQTCDSYLNILESIIEGDELKRTKELVKEFQKPGGVGERLQKGLERKACSTDNWLTEDYVKQVYLHVRKPVAVFSNTGSIHPRASFRDKQGQIRCAAKSIQNLVEFKDKLPVEHIKGIPLCMAQCTQILSSCRVPGLETDSLMFHGKSANPPEHVTIAHNGQFFVLDVKHSDGTPLTVDELCVQLERICSPSAQTVTEPVGILTTQHRDIWSKSYSNLIKDETNKESLAAIESSLATVCLDEAMPPISDERYFEESGSYMLHGGGSQYSSGNRWFDKGLQLIIGEDGTWGANCSHAAADGTVLVYLSDYLVSHVNRETPQITSTSRTEPLPEPQKLHFNITPEIKKDIEEAKQHIDKLVQSLDVLYRNFDYVGKNVLMAMKSSPDAFIQMAIQLAYYRMYQRSCSTLEAVSLRMYRGGRLGIINSNSRTSAAFVKAFDDPQIKDSEKADLLEKAVQAHHGHTKMAMRGQLVEGHLMGLMTQAVEENIPMPDLFIDPPFAKAFNYETTTAQVLTRVGCLPCVGPERPDTYQLIYSVRSNHVKMMVTTLKVSNTGKENMSADFLQAVGDAMMDMRNLKEQILRSE